MTFQNTLITLFISLTFSLSGSLAVAQQLAKEPAGGMEENDMETGILLPPSTISIPSIIDMPALNKFYKSWDTLYVRRYSEIPPLTDDSVALPLFNTYSTGFVFPIEGKFLSPFGYRGRRVHAGVDIKLEAGDPVSAAFDGVVRMARRYSGYGNCVVVRHYNGIETLYGHLSKIKVKVNQQVKAGDIIGLGGRTGRATCNHLHFETRFQGKAFNPKQMINFDTYTLLSDTFNVTRSTYGLARDYLPSLTCANIVEGKSDDNVTKRVNEKHGNKGIKSSKSNKYHTIKKGDTLGALSAKYGTSVKQICSINGIKPTKTLKLGTKLRIR